jgi:hypothetical protein
MAFADLKNDFVFRRIFATHPDIARAATAASAEQVIAWTSARAALSSKRCGKGRTAQRAGAAVSRWTDVHDGGNSPESKLP